MTSDNGDGARPHGPLELNEVLHIATKDGASLPFQVVGILEDPDDGTEYAVLLHEAPDRGDGEFIVTDLDGNLLEGELAQEIVDEFLLYADEDE